MTCSLCSREIPEDRLRKHSKFCSVECQKTWRLLYMRFRKLANGLWEMILAEHRKQHSEASNVVTEAV